MKMDGYTPEASFGPEAAARFDDALRGDEDVAARFLAGLVGNGRDLELAIGTGRIGLPLRAQECRGARRVDG